MNARPDARVALSVIIPSRDEAHNVPRVLAMLEAQTRQPDEIVVADGMSTDGSRELWREARVAGRPVVLVDNPERVVPTGLNAALAAARGAVVARMDTHADYAPDYLEKVAGHLEANPGLAGVGGAMDTQGRGAWGAAIASTLVRPFGLGGAAHRVGGAAGPIPHVFSGCYRRAAVVAAGGWDPRFSANEDFEADQRIAAQGGLWLLPEATSTWYVRDTPAKLAKQMWRYGYFKALTLAVHPGSLKVRQLAPPAVVLGLLGATLVDRRLGAAAAASYAAAAGALGARAARADGASAWRGAVVPPVVHLSWGAGLVVGTFRFRARGRVRPVNGPGASR